MGLKVRFRKFFFSTALLWSALLSTELSILYGSGSRLFIGQLGWFGFEAKQTLRQRLTQSLEAGELLESQENARRLAMHSPLDEIPYEAAMAIAYSNGDEYGAAGFANRALALQPRSLAARLYLFSQSAKRRDFQSTIQHYERLIELGSLNKSVLSEAIVGVFRESGDWSVLIDFLLTEPISGRELMHRLLDEQVLPPGFESAVSRYPSVQVAYLKRIAEDQGLRTAYNAWQSISSLSESELVELPFNANLQIRSEPAPFNWSLQYHRAEMQERGGLFVSFTGAGTPMIVQQTFKAPAGDYFLRTRAIGLMPKNGGALEWFLYCAGSNKIIGRSMISLSKKSEPENFETKVTIPEMDCAFQTIQLRGSAGAFPKISRTEISSVSLVEIKKHENYHD